MFPVPKDTLMNLATQECIEIVFNTERKNWPEIPCSFVIIRQMDNFGAVLQVGTTQNLRNYAKKWTNFEPIANNNGNRLIAFVESDYKKRWMLKRSIEKRVYRGA